MPRHLDLHGLLPPVVPYPISAALEEEIHFPKSLRKWELHNIVQQSIWSHSTPASLNVNF